MKTVVVTGSAGFLGTYVCQVLLDKGYKVIGIDNYSKYGKIKRSHDDHPNYELHVHDCMDTIYMYNLLKNADHIVHLAAFMGGIRFFHDHAYDMMSNNETICCSVFDAAIRAFHNNKLKKFTLVTSSQVYENTKNFPTTENETSICPPADSTYGFQKLAAEYFAYGASQQHNLPFTILRPFNCIGIGEKPGTYMDETEKQIAMNHVVPEFVQKCIRSKGETPIEILGDGKQVRTFTHGKDFALAVLSTIENDESFNKIYNVCGTMKMEMIELLNIIWNRLYPGKELKVTHAEAYTNDVRYRFGTSEKLIKEMNWSPSMKIEDSIDEIIEYIKKETI